MTKLHIILISDLKLFVIFQSSQICLAAIAKILKEVQKKSTFLDLNLKFAAILWANGKI